MLNPAYIIRKFCENFSKDIHPKKNLLNSEPIRALSEMTASVSAKNDDNSWGANDNENGRCQSHIEPFGEATKMTADEVMDLTVSKEEKLSQEGLFYSHLAGIIAEQGGCAKGLIDYEQEKGCLDFEKNCVLESIIELKEDNEMTALEKQKKMTALEEKIKMIESKERTISSSIEYMRDAIIEMNKEIFYFIQGRREKRCGTWQQPQEL